MKSKDSDLASTRSGKYEKKVVTNKIGKKGSIVKDDKYWQRLRNSNCQFK